MTPKEYPNIIFDFGGVILNLDYQRTTTAFQKLGVKDFAESYSQLEQDELFDRFERGEISPAIFRDGLRSAFLHSVSDEQLDRAWNAMLLDLPSVRLELLRKLGTEKRISLLSNTNEIHVESFEAALKRDHGLDDLSGLFEKVYYSCRTGMRKPETRIFEMVLREQGYSASETLFIDDSPQHIEGARKAGLHVYHLRADQGETIHDLFGDFLTQFHQDPRCVFRVYKTDEFIVSTRLWCLIQQSETIIAQALHFCVNVLNRKGHVMNAFATLFNEFGNSTIWRGGLKQFYLVVRSLEECGYHVLRSHFFFFVTGGVQ